jgi:hypothetical protein
MRPFARVLVPPIALLLAALAVFGCSTKAVPPTLTLQRDLLPGLADLPPEKIAAAYETRVELTPPLSAGVAWLEERSDGASFATLNEYQRTGVLNVALAELRQAPFDAVASFPTSLDVERWGGPKGGSLDGLRSAAARFQFDLAVLMQTGLADGSGWNLLAAGFIPLVTIPLFPGNDLSLAASAELCAVDARSGVMLACARGRGVREQRFVFPLSVASRKDELAEACMREAVTAAAQDLRAQLVARVAPVSARSE